jgi:hypothetical protein
MLNFLQAWTLELTSERWGAGRIDGSATRVRWTTVLATSLMGLLVACHGGFDSTRQPVDNGSFGELLHTLACKRVAYLDDLADGGSIDVAGKDAREFCRQGTGAPTTSSASLQALQSERERLVTAIDVAFPESLLPDLQTMLTSAPMLAATDTDQSVRAVDGQVATLRLLGNDTSVTQAFERLSFRVGYRPAAVISGAPAAVMIAPMLDSFVNTFTTAVTSGGVAAPAWQQLNAALAASFRNAQPAGPTDQTLRIARDFFLADRAGLATAAEIPLVVRDQRGVARVKTIAAPFVDGNGDGLADIDAVGRFIDASGAAIAAPSPFRLAPVSAGAPVDAAPPWPFRDTQTRALTVAEGPLLYQHLNLDRTVLAALSRDAAALVQSPTTTATDLLRGAAVLSGPRIDSSRSYPNGDIVTFRGFDNNQSALLDLVHGYLAVLRDPAINDTLGLLQNLLTNRQPQVARLAEAVVVAARKADAHPEATVLTNAPLWDDLVPLLRRVVANPALSSALLAALELPEVGQLGQRFRTFMTYRDRFDINPANQAVVGDFATLVDRNAPDSNFDRSIFQRLVHVISASNGARACNKSGARVVDPFLGITLGTYGECALFNVDNVAVLYLQSIAYAKNSAGQIICEGNGGAFDPTTTAATAAQCVAQGRRPQTKANFNFNWGGLVSFALDTLGGDGFLENTVGISGMRSHPTPQGLNRVLFLNPTPSYLLNIINPLKDKEGDTFFPKHAGTLPAWERDGFYDQLRPIVQAFADANEEALFVDLLSTLHKHWASPQSTNHQTSNPAGAGYVFGSGANRYEGLVADILQDGSLMAAVTAAAPPFNQTQFAGKGYRTIVANAVTYLLTPRPGLLNRQGSAVSTTADGRPVSVLSPWQLLADANVNKQSLLAAVGADAKNWTDSIAEIVDVYFRGSDVAGSGWQFANPRTVGVLQATVSLLQDRIAVHDVQGDRVQWLREDLLASISDALTSPLFVAAADFLTALEQTPAARDDLVSLLRYLLDDSSLDTGFVATLTAVADVMQLAVDDQQVIPLVRAVGQMLDPSKGWIDAQLTLLQAARAGDSKQTLVSLLRNMYLQSEPGRSVISDVIDGIVEVHRQQPFVDRGKPLSAADYSAVFNGVANFLDEERRGLRRFIAIIKTRNP